jgi:hypothetical protein
MSTAEASSSSSSSSSSSRSSTSSSAADGTSQVLGGTTLAARQDITPSFVDTSSKFGHGRFQTAAEKAKYTGPTKSSQR